MAKKSPKPAPLELPTGMMAGMVRLETPDGYGYIQGGGGNIEIISARTYYQGRGRPSTDKKISEQYPGRWLTTRSGNKLFVLSTIENRAALGLPED